MKIIKADENPNECSIARSQLDSMYICHAFPEAYSQREHRARITNVTIIPSEQLVWYVCNVEPTRCLRGIWICPEAAHAMLVSKITRNEFNAAHGCRNSA